MRSNKVNVVESLKEAKHFNWKTTTFKEKSIPKSKRFLINYWKVYCTNTSVHGIKYISADDFHWTERLTWAMLVGIASCCCIYVSILLSKRYNANTITMTVLDSTFFHISEIPYPAVSICTSNRMNYGKIDRAIERYIPGATEIVLSNFKALLYTFETLDFGSFDEMNEIVNITSKSLDHIDLDELYDQMSFSCGDLFESCWWRNRYVNCCDEFFFKQKSEYGYCFAFNSGSSENVPLSNRTDDFARRTAASGEWGALRVLVNTFAPSNSKRLDKTRGIFAIVHHPLEWPNIAHFIPAGTKTSIAIKPTAFYTSPNVRRLTFKQRACINQDEVETLSNNVMHLKDHAYLRPNCISECRQRYLLQYCNCTLKFFYPPSGYPACNLTGLICMSRYNDIFNYEKPPLENKFFDAEDEGMACDCLPECERIAYGTEINPNIVANDNPESILLAVFFKSPTMVRYRTDVVFSWLDLLVGFGGIVGLFLGCSLISGVEMIYYLTIGLYWHDKRRFKNDQTQHRIKQAKSYDSDLRHTMVSHLSQ